jgi:hypothetical protein
VRNLFALHELNATCSTCNAETCDALVDLTLIESAAETVARHGCAFLFCGSEFAQKFMQLLFISMKIQCLKLVQDFDVINTVALENNACLKLSMLSCYV